MTKNKKIYFYKITINDKNGDSTNVLTLIQSTPEYNKSESFSCKLIEDSDKTLVEFLQITNEYIFGRIGKEDDLNYLHFRSMSSINKSENILVPQNSYTEKFTYFYFNLTTNIMCYLSIHGAPPFSKFKRFINQLCLNKFDSSIIPVANKDIVKILKKKDRISGFIIKTTVPVDEFLGCDNLNIDRNYFTQLENAKEVTIELTLNAKRNKNISKTYGENNPIFNIVNNVLNKNDKAKAKIKANNTNEATRIYDLDEDIYTYNMNLPEIRNEVQFTKEMLNSLIQAYNNSIEDILILSR